MVKVFYFVFLLFMSTFAFSDVSDSIIVGDSAAMRLVMKKLDQIDAKLTVLIAEKNDFNPLPLDKKSERGKGLSITIRPGMYALGSVSVEACYMLKPRNVRYGLMIGGYKNIYNNVNSDHVYAGIVIGTPVFVNFVSLSGFYEYQYYRSAEFFGAINSRFGNCLGADLELWASPNVCFTLGSSATLLNRKKITSDKTALLGSYTWYETSKFGIRFFIPGRKK